jgi:Arc/MetJ family transcription regulator
LRSSISTGHLLVIHVQLKERKANRLSNMAYRRMTWADERGRPVIFKAVQQGRPYPDHGLSARDWANVAPRTIRLDELITTKKELALDHLLDEDSTFYGDLFPHAVQWQGEVYLEDGLHRALRAALENRHTMHVRILDLDALRRP